MTKIVKYIYAACIVFLLTGCVKKDLPDNIVAKVNDSPITLSTLRSLQDIDFIDLSATSTPTLASLRKQYGITLSRVILYEIILQYIENNGYIVSSEQVEAYEKNLRLAYPPDEFEKYITENAIDLDTWRILLKYQLAIESFKKNILIRSYVASVEDVKKYYAKHKDNFNLQPSYSLSVGISYDKAKLENINIINELNTINEIEKYNITIQEKAIPKEWSKAILALKQGECTDILEQNNIFSSICLIKQNPKRSLSISQAYPYIENELAQAHISEMLQIWLEENIQNVEIKLSKHLAKEIL